MTPDVIQFSCPACQAPLTVPAHLAGVSGPCPKCGQTVTSPPATAAPTFTPQPAPFPPAPAAPPPQPPNQPPNQPTAPLPSFPPAPAWSATPPPAQVATPAPSNSPSLDAGLPPRRPASTAPTSSLLNAPLSTPAAPVTSPSIGQTLPHLGGDASAPPTLPALGGLLNQSFDPPASEPPLTGSILSNVLPSRKPAEPHSTDLGSPDSPKFSDPLTTVSNRQPLPPFPNRPSKSSSLTRLAIALVMLLGALGLLAYFFATPLRQLYDQYLAPHLTTEDSADLGDPTPEDPLSTDAAPISPPPASGPSTPTVTADQPTLPEVIQKAEPAPASADIAMPKIEPLKPDGLMEVPQPPPGEAPLDALQFSQPPAFATVIPDPAKPAADALVAFLAAETLDEKRKFILGAEDPQVANLIDRYYGSNSPGPIPVTTIGFIRHDPNPEVGGGMQSVFMVASPDWKYPIPVMLQETKSGIKLDWIAFTEFKDDWLFKFVEAFRPDPARFHVSIRRGHYFDRDVPDLDKKHCFFIQPPQEHFEVAVFVPKNTPLADMLGRELSWGTQNAYVLAEIHWRDDGEFKWVELTAVPQLNWHITIEPPPARK